MSDMVLASPPASPRSPRRAAAVAALSLSSSSASLTSSLRRMRVDGSRSVSPSPSPSPSPSRGGGGGGCRKRHSSQMLTAPEAEAQPLPMAAAAVAAGAPLPPMELRKRCRPSTRDASFEEVLYVHRLTAEEAAHFGGSAVYSEGRFYRARLLLRPEASAARREAQAALRRCHHAPQHDSPDGVVPSSSKARDVAMVDAHAQQHCCGQSQKIVGSFLGRIQALVKAQQPLAAYHVLQGLTLAMDDDASWLCQTDVLHAQPTVQQLARVWTATLRVLALARTLPDGGELAEMAKVVARFDFKLCALGITDLGAAGAYLTKLGAAR